MKKQADDEHKFKIPELPNELKQVTSLRDKAYLDYIKLLQQKLRQDFMTGLEHKEQFESSEKTSAGVFIYVDGDGLKKLNDSLGHEAGSTAIMALAQGIKGALRSRDNVQVARMGGDEFAVYVEDASMSTGVAIAKRILESINSQKLSDFYKGSDLKIKEVLSQLNMKASLGVGRTKEEADKALYEAKQKGRNRVEFFKAKPLAALSTRITLLASKFDKIGKKHLAKKLADLGERFFYYKGKDLPYRELTDIDPKSKQKLILHRLDGPAYKYGREIQYWVNGEQIDKDLFEKIRWCNDISLLTWYATGQSSAERTLAETRLQEI